MTAETSRSALPNRDDVTENNPASSTTPVTNPLAQRRSHDLSGFRMTTFLSEFVEEWEKGKARELATHRHAIFTTNVLTSGSKLNHLINFALLANLGKNGFDPQ